MEKHQDTCEIFHSSVLYCKATLDGEAQVFLDPNALSKEGDVSLRGYAFSEDGQLFAYGLSESGSDWVTIHVRFVVVLLVIHTMSYSFYHL